MIFDNKFLPKSLKRGQIKMKALNSLLKAWEEICKKKIIGFLEYLKTRKKIF